MLLPLHWKKLAESLCCDGHSLQIFQYALFQHPAKMDACRIPSVRSAYGTTARTSLTFALPHMTARSALSCSTFPVYIRFCNMRWMMKQVQQVLCQILCPLRHLPLSYITLGQ